MVVPTLAATIIPWLSVSHEYRSQWWCGNQYLRRHLFRRKWRSGRLAPPRRV